MFSFSIKNLKLFNDLKSFLLDRISQGLKLFRFSVSPIGHDGFVEFLNLNAALLFHSKKRQYFFQKLTEGMGTNAPNSNSRMSSIGGFAINDTTSKSLDNPREYGKSCVADLKRDHSIFRSALSFRLPSFDTKATFCINKTCEIGKIGTRWLNGLVHRFKRIYFFFCDKIDHMNTFLYAGYNGFSREVLLRCSGLKVVFNNSLSKLYEKIANAFLRNKKVMQSFSDWNAFSGFYYPEIRIFSVASFFRSFAIGTTKFFGKILNNFFAYRTDLNGVIVDKNIFWFLDVFTNVKASVPVYVSSQISIFEGINVHKAWHYTGKRKYGQYPQRLTGEGLEFSRHVIV